MSLSSDLSGVAVDTEVARETIEVAVDTEVAMETMEVAVDTGVALETMEVSLAMEITMMGIWEVDGIGEEKKLGGEERTRYLRCRRLTLSWR